MTTEHPRALRRLGQAVVVAAAALSMAAAAGPAAAAPSYSASVETDTLTVTGTNQSDRIALRLRAGAPDTLEVDFGDDGAAEFTFDRSAFSRIEVVSGNGNDEFRVDQVNGAFADEALTVDGGKGDDILNGGDASELFIGRGGNDSVDGNRGNDTAQLGSGDDSFRWDPGDGSDVVEGQAGTDRLDFNGAGGNENMSLLPNGSRSLFLRDAGNIRMDLNKVERLELTALGGIDTFTVDDMTGTHFRQADVDLSAPTGGADGAADVVIVNGSRRPDDLHVSADGARVAVEGLANTVRIIGSETTDLLQVNTLEGNDDVNVDEAVFSLIDVAVDPGTGQR
jgi:hypothetical protein